MSDRSVENDFSTLIGMYSSNDSKELFYPSPFYPCEIIKFNPNIKRYYRNKNISIHLNILLYCLFRFREKYFSGTNVLDLEYIKRIPESPLQVFGIEVDRIFEFFNNLRDNLRKKIVLSRTAGIKTLNFGTIKEEELLKEVYGSTEDESLLL
jgi:hypothetical protein